MTSLGGREPRLGQCVGESGVAIPGVQELAGNSPPVVGDLDGDAAAALVAAQLHLTPRRLSGLLALGGRLEPVRHRVAEQMADRLRDPVQDHPVELRVGAADRQLGLLALIRGEVAHGAGEGRRDRAEREGPHLDHRVL